MEAVELIDFCFAYPVLDGRQAGAGEGFNQAPAALEHVNLTVPVGSFTLLCGMTGSGKSTLLQCLKPELAPVGTRSGIVRVLGEVQALGSVAVTREAGSSPGFSPEGSLVFVGFVLQDAEAQIVTDTVWHELAFGLENLGVPSNEIHRRVAETASYFGIAGWFEQKTSELSGGQKQLLNLAAIMVMQPQLLLLDEPTAQLDPLATKEFLATLARVNQELGVTVLVAEHHLEDTLPLCDQVAFIGTGTIAFAGDAQAFIAWCAAKLPAFIPALPAATRLALAAEQTGQGEPNSGYALQESRATPCPITVREGRAWLTTRQASSLLPGCVKELEPLVHPASHDKAPLLVARQLWFGYGRTLPPVLRGIELKVQRGRVHAIVGANGSGKSTLLSVLAGVHRPQRGKVTLQESLRLATLPQDPKALFCHDTLLQDLMENSKRFDYHRLEIEALMESFGLAAYAHRHPYDLSAGEQQKAALAKLLLLKPDILLLDEPTKGLDAFAKQELHGFLDMQTERGSTIVLVSHDLDFVAECADTCSLLFNGELVGTAPTHGFFAGNLFYTTAIERITQGILPGCVTLKDVLAHE